ncbi:hypothetical protein L5515_015609 [Caenorhabditis briggsae]|uniref:Uncharacterized protein n=1 Tax=Caenorhabditis briggsae TaxID=6238 RepID=A0AAE9EGH9_CAEBR|nr:hypothetical protein L5515_015609 [Caenorhabditis briggsae]
MMCPPTFFGTTAQFFYPTEMVFAMPPPHYAPMPLAFPMQPSGFGYFPQPQPCGSYSEENKENAGPSNFKTWLCKLHNSGKSIVCPHGANCRFAHGVEELRSNGSIPDHQVTSKSYKTMLCRNSAPGGSGDCPYRLACQYIHPSDGLLYKFCQADTPEFKVLKGQHQEAIQKLHAQKMMVPPSQQFQLEASINWKVRQFNVGHPNGEDYHDLHGMTTMGMVSYIQDIVEQMRRTGGTKAWLEVGRGTHSANGFPAMKTHLMNNCHLFPGCSFVPIIAISNGPSNDVASGAWYSVPCADPRGFVCKLDATTKCDNPPVTVSPSINNPSGCNQGLLMFSGVITSPRYPAVSYDGPHCTYSLATASGSRIFLKFTEFSNDKSDVITVYDSDGKTTLGAFSGTSGPFSVKSSENTMTVKTNGNLYNTRVLFKASFASV